MSRCHGVNPGPGGRGYVDCEAPAKFEYAWPHPNREDEPDPKQRAQYCPRHAAKADEAGCFFWDCWES